MTDRAMPGSTRRDVPVIGMTRRRFLKTALAGGAVAVAGEWPLDAGAGLGRRPTGPSVAVVGAGAFGGWTALHLLRRGADVTLFDAWGAGHARSSSGGESRVIRGIYGGDAIYVDWVVRSFELWRWAEEAWSSSLYTPTGALWIFRDDDSYARASLPLLRERGLEVKPLSAADAEERYPMIDFGSAKSIYFERAAGFLGARDACRRLKRAFAADGGRYRRARVTPGPIRNGRVERLELSDGSTFEADRFVFACGPWLGQLFPELLGPTLTPTRQEVYYFGTPPGSDAFSPDRFPVWVDFGERIFYGIPGNHGHGFKVADDTRGEPVDPTDVDRTPGREGIARARALLAERFPRLADAPLVESRVCQYTNSPDGHYVLDRHPEAENLWLAGAGSGHGFKLGPAVGAHVADLVLGRTDPLAMFSVDRLAAAGKDASQFDGEGEGRI